jgi:predicted dehydrogenase
MFRTLIIGLGRAGLGLHWAVLNRLRTAGRHTDLFDPRPVLALDPVTPSVSVSAHGLHPVPSLSRARAQLEPERTVVHLCTPPVSRLDLLRELTALGFRRIIVEKPLATDRTTAENILSLVRTHRLSLTVVAPWLASTLTARLAALTEEGQLGSLRSIEVRQCKPRMRRTLLDDGHPTAFDIEPPHSLGVCLRLAGDARLVTASLADMRIGDSVIPHMGRAELLIRHEPFTGQAVTSSIVSDLTSPIRERRIRLEFEGGQVVAHYPNGEDDHYAHLRIGREGSPGTREIFPDDALSAYLVGAYRGFRDGADLDEELLVGHRTVELLADAKERSLSGAQAAPTDTTKQRVAYAS